MYKKAAIILENTQRRASKMVNSLSNLTYDGRLKSGASYFEISRAES